MTSGGTSDGATSDEETYRRRLLTNGEEAYRQGYSRGLEEAAIQENGPLTQVQVENMAHARGTRARQRVVRDAQEQEERDQLAHLNSLRATQRHGGTGVSTGAGGTGGFGGTGGTGGTTGGTGGTTGGTGGTSGTSGGSTTGKRKTSHSSSPHQNSTKRPRHALPRK